MNDEYIYIYIQVAELPLEIKEKGSNKLLDFGLLLKEVFFFK